MEIIYAIILGLIEGLTEYIPVSSTGHLVIAMPLLGVDAEQAPWKILLWLSQFASILAVVLIFWRDLWSRVVRRPERGWQSHILAKLTAAMLPTIVIALLLNEYFEPLEKMPIAVAAALILGAGVMELIDRRTRRDAPQTLDDVTLRQAFLIGLIQCISMWPGVSRSGATIMGGMALGLTPRVATEFSFYLAIPTMLLAALHRLLKYGDELQGSHITVLLVGCATSFVVSIASVLFLLEFVKKRRFTVFAAYRVVLGAAVLLHAWLF